MIADKVARYRRRKVRQIVEARDRQGCPKFFDQKKDDLRSAAETPKPDKNIAMVAPR